MPCLLVYSNHDARHVRQLLSVETKHMSATARQYCSGATNPPPLFNPSPAGDISGRVHNPGILRSLLLLCCLASGCSRHYHQADRRGMNTASCHQPWPTHAPAVKQDQIELALERRSALAIAPLSDDHVLYYGGAGFVLCLISPGMPFATTQQAYFSRGLLCPSRRIGASEVAIS